MKLLLTTYPGSGEELLVHHIQQRLERPHVPLQFSVGHDVSTEADYLITVVRSPGESIGTRLARETELSVESAIKEYNDLYTHLLANANMVVKHEDLDKIDKIILSLFNELNLDAENYKNKTDRVLSEDILLQPENPMDSETVEGIAGVDFEGNINDSTALYDQVVSKALDLQS